MELQNSIIYNVRTKFVKYSTQNAYKKLYLLTVEYKIDHNILDRLGFALF